MSEFEVSAHSNSAQANPVSSAPFRLREAREAAGLHIAALAAVLKVPVKKMEALEAGRYHELPDMTFARALASSACRQLKVDPAAVLEQIPSAMSPMLDDPTTFINAPFKSGDEVSGTDLKAWVARPVVWGAGLLLLAAAAVALLPQGLIGDFQDPAAPAASATAPGLVVEPLAPVTAEPAVPLGVPSVGSVSVEGDPVIAGQPVADTAPVAELQAVMPTAAEPAPVVGGSVLLSIRAVNESWIEVVSGSGAQVLQRVLKPGEVLDFSTAPPYAVVVGRADAVQVTVRGQPFDVMPFARNSVARFEVK